jgi:drug/metabolite transporter (DMT)-like permease
MGMGLYAFDSLMNTRLTDEPMFPGISHNLVIAIGFGCCVVSGLTRSLGMTLYRQIKTEVDPVTIVSVHAIMCTIVVIPILCK